MADNNAQKGMQAPAPANSLPVGTRMHEYEIKAVIGEGGFGIVYLATDTLLGREVAIKEYLPISHATRRDPLHVQARTPDQQGLFEKGLKSFVAEARILAQFRNPNLVEVLRFWEGNGTAYIVMPYYKGKTLRELQQKGFRVTDQISLFNLLLPLMSGLQQVHAVGCFHRDISLDNIIVLPDGSPMLIDFGAARHEIINQADSSTVILKPGFAPIEQYGGKETAQQQGPWTDIYALCAVAYQLITGVAPPSSVARIMRDPLVPLAEQSHGANLLLPVLKAIDAGLQVQPEDRPQSIPAFKAMLLAKEPVLAAGSDAARVHQQPLAAAVPLAASTVPASHAAPVGSTETVPVRVVRTPSGLAQYAWIALMALLIVLVIAGVLFWQGQSENTPSEMPPASIAAPQIAAPETAVTAGQAVSDDAQNPNWQSVVVPRTEGVAAGVADGMAPAQTGMAVATDAAEAAVPTGIAQPQAGQTATAALTGSESQMSHELSLQANETFLPDTGSPFGLADAQPQFDVVDTAQEQEPYEVPIPTVGYVLVQAQPWGDVYLNGALVGTTPPSLRVEVPIGSNTIEVRNDSAATHTQTLTVQGGQTVRVNHHFAR